MNTLAAFTFSPEGGGAITLRAVQIHGDPWFVARDVCGALGMDLHSGASRWTAGLAADEKQTVAYSLIAPQNFCGAKGRGGMRGGSSIGLISEPGLYKLILRAHPDRVPVVRQFQDWVTKVVLPTIRKEGVYVMGEEKLNSPAAAKPLDLNDLDALRDQIETLMARKAELLEKRLAAAEAKVEELAPKAAIVDAAFETRLPTLRVFARTLDGVDLIRLPGFLAAMGFLYRHVGPKSGEAVYRVRAEHRGVLFTEKHHVNEGWVTVFPTVAGQERLVALYRAGKLPMRRGFAPSPAPLGLAA